MERLRTILGPLGLLLILIGGVTYGILYASGWVSVIPLVLGIVLVALSAILALRGGRTEGARRGARAGINAAVSVVALAAILIFLQTIASRHSARLDTTSNKRFSLSAQTDKILAGLARDVRITAFFKADSPERTEFSDLLKEYARTSPRVKYELVDPDKDPVVAKRFNVANYGTTVLESGGAEDRISEITEEKLTNAIARVTRETKKTIYCLTGHGEKSIDDTETTGLSQMRADLEAEGYAVKNLLTMRDTIPADCAVLLVPGPENDLFPPERAMIQRYLDDGGKLLLLVDPMISVPLVDSIGARYGIVFTNTIIVDRFGKLLAGNYLTPVVNAYKRHPITEGFRQASLFPQARALVLAPAMPPGVDAVVLASTGQSAYAEANLSDVLKGKTQYEPATDRAGPIDVAIVSTREPGPAVPGARKPSRVVAFGDSDFASNAYLGLAGNKDLILNTISWLAEEQDLIAIRAASPVSQPVVLKATQGRIVFWVPVVGLPALVFAVGALVAARRRRAS